MYGQHLVNQIKAQPQLVSDQTLHVVAVISNYARWHSRYRLFREWYAKMLATPHVKVYVVEACFGDRAPEVTTEGDPTHLTLRTTSEIWVKENLINLGVRHLLPRDWRYVAWIDADVEFRDDQWAAEAMQQLQHYPIIQPWQSAVDLGPNGQIMSTFSSFGYLTEGGKRPQATPAEPYQYGHTGFAWACTREFWERVGGLLDCAILGSGDHHMAWACYGRAQDSVHGAMDDAFKARVMEWQAKALPLTHGHVGYSSGRIEHNFHGPKKRRAYRERWQILVDAKFDPAKDLYYDASGLLQLRGKPALEADIRSYNRSRSEDSIEVD